MDYHICHLTILECIVLATHYTTIDLESLKKKQQELNTETEDTIEALGRGWVFGHPPTSL